MELKVRPELTKEEIIKILNEIKFINNISLANENRINGMYITVEKAFRKLYARGIFSEYCDNTKQELETGLVDIVPILENLDIEGLDFRISDFMFFIDSDIVRQNIYLKAIQTFGEAPQKMMVVEEMAELTQAISKSLRRQQHNIEEEIADVEIMLGQLKEMADIDKNLIEEFREEKLKRLEGMVW
jgi:NTP pyrophosphatase (non-canonical NTP hydrolase)